MNWRITALPTIIDSGYWRVGPAQLGRAMDIISAIWYLTFTLFILAVLQMVYIIWLTLTRNRRENTRQPSSPIMPTNPQSAYATNHPTNVPSGGGRSAYGRLVILSGGVRGPSEIPLPSSEFIIGRFYNPEQKVLIALDEKSISRRHAVFSSDDATREYRLIDSGSSYGTAIRKEGKFEAIKPDQPERLYNDDVVMFGTSVTVRFVLPGDTRSAATRL